MDNFMAVKSGEIEIEHDQVETLVLHGIDCAGTVGSHGDFVTGALQRPTDVSDKICMIFNDEDSHAWQ
jgi:hypothetical protein